jgi:hypothetical protein
MDKNELVCALVVVFIFVILGCLGLFDTLLKIFELF